MNTRICLFRRDKHAFKFICLKIQRKKLNKNNERAKTKIDLIKLIQTCLHKSNKLLEINQDYCIQTFYFCSFTLYHDYTVYNWELISLSYTKFYKADKCGTFIIANPNTMNQLTAMLDTSSLNFLVN